MIKKTILLVTALMIAASSATYAAKSKAKSIRVTNEGKVAYFYKVGNSVKKIEPGSSKSFSLKGLKRVKITSGERKSKNNNVTGNVKVLKSLSIAQAKADPIIQTNPVTGQTTDLTK
jgi:hypothetical protein